MIWKIFNKLFGWQYVLAECGYKKDVSIKRVEKLGNKFYYRCNGRILLVQKHKYSHEPTIVPYTMSQENFDKMVEINYAEV